MSQTPPHAELIRHSRYERRVVDRYLAPEVEGYVAAVLVVERA